MQHDPWNEDVTEVTFRDLINNVFFKMVLGLVALIMMALPFLAEKSQKRSDEGANNPGNVMVEVRWPDGLDADVDLWVKAPGDVPVGYSNKSGLIFNLLRDDLGTYADPLKINMETSYSRGIPPGEYIVNLHLFRNKAGTYPVPVDILVSCKVDTTTTQLIVTHVDLTHEGQEYTAIRWRMDEKCVVDESSKNNVFRALRSGSK